jgi:hypothetical protein
MTNPITRIFNGETNEFEDRPMNKEEYAAFLEYVASKETEKVEREAKIASKAALLDRLGITEDEAKLLLA